MQEYDRKIVQELLKVKKPAVDYRDFRLRKLNSSEFCHLKYLLYWPVCGVAFLFLERFYHPKVWHSISCELDSIIPFNEWFVVPYLLWFVFLIGMMAYMALYDVDSFKKMSRFMMITYTVTIIIYFIYPNVQELRPTSFERDNVLTRLVAFIYTVDTNTNVCPSLHVVGSVAAMSAGLHCPQFQNTGWRVLFVLTASFTSISTVFLKQHSAVDLLVALPLCLAAYHICYHSEMRKA